MRGFHAFSYTKLGPFEGGHGHVTSCVFCLSRLDSMISAHMKSRENDPLQINFESSTETLPYSKFLVSATTKISFCVSKISSFEIELNQMFQII